MRKQSILSIILSRKFTEQQKTKAISCNKIFKIFFLLSWHLLYIKLMRYAFNTRKNKREMYHVITKSLLYSTEQIIYYKYIK